MLTATTSFVTPRVLASWACSRVCPPRSNPVSNSPCTEERLRSMLLQSRPVQLRPHKPDGRPIPNNATDCRCPDESKSELLRNPGNAVLPHGDIVYSRMLDQRMRKENSVLQCMKSGTRACAIWSGDKQPDKEGSDGPRFRQRFRSATPPNLLALMKLSTEQNDTVQSCTI